MSKYSIAKGLLTAMTKGNITKDELVEKAKAAKVWNTYKGSIFSKIVEKPEEKKAVVEKKEDKKQTEDKKVSVKDKGIKSWNVDSWETSADGKGFKKNPKLTVKYNDGTSKTFTYDNPGDYANKLSELEGEGAKNTDKFIREFKDLDSSGPQAGTWRKDEYGRKQVYTGEYWRTLKAGESLPEEGEDMNQYLDKLSSGEEGATEDVADVTGDFSTDDEDFAEYLTYQEHLDSLPDQGASIIQQWEDMAVQQIGDEFTNLLGRVDTQTELFKEGQALETDIATEQKATSERYITEDLERYLSYSDEDKTKALTQVDENFAKAMSSAASGYLDLGIRLGSGALRKTAAEAREGADLQREGIVTTAERGEEGAMTDAERERAGLVSGYQAYVKRQALATKTQGIQSEDKKEDIELAEKKDKETLIEKRKKEARLAFTTNQLRTY